MKVTSVLLRSFAEWKDAVRSVDAFAREVASILNGGVRFADQLAMEIKTVQYKNGTQLAVKTRLSKQPLAVLVLSTHLSRGTSANLITTGGYVTWTWMDGFVTIQEIIPLTPGELSTVTLAFVEA